MTPQELMLMFRGQNPNSFRPMDGESEGTFSPEDAAMMQDAGWFGGQQAQAPNRLGQMVKNDRVSVVPSTYAQDSNALQQLFQGAIMGNDLDKATRLANTPEQRALLDIAYQQRIEDQDRRARMDAGRPYDAPRNRIAEFGNMQNAANARKLMEQDRLMKIQQFFSGQKRDAAQTKQIESATRLADERAQNEALRDPNAPKPPPDMRVGRGGEFEVIPNSKLDMKQKKDFAQDRDAVNTMEVTMNSLIDNIDQIIGSDMPDEKTGKAKYQQHPGLRGAVGYIDSKVFPFTGDQADAKSLIGTLKSKSSVEGLQALRKSGTAPGSITEKEWQIFQNYIGRVDDAQGEEQYVQGLKELRALARERLGYVQNTFKEKYSGGGGNGTEVTLPDGRVKRFRSSAEANAYRKAAGLQ